MAKSSVKDRALVDNDLLNRVVAFKDKFYRCPWARYDLAKRGTMHLLPPEYNIPKLEEDYENGRQHFARCRKFSKTLDIAWLFTLYMFFVFRIFSLFFKLWWTNGGQNSSKKT